MVSAQVKQVPQLLQKTQYRLKTHTLNIADKPAHEHSIREITPIYDEQNQSYQSENTARKEEKKAKLHTEA